MNNNLTKKPINISPKNVYGKCDLKCAYNFKYNQSNLTARNNGINISLTYDNSKVPPVIYNSEKYNVTQILLFSPSLHLFNDKKVDAEIIIGHTPEIGGENLFVCVPITKSSESSEGSMLLSRIIAGVASNAPADSETTNLNLSEFSLNKIVPKSPFFSYSGNFNNATANFIVFGQNNAISLNEQILGVLGSIIKPFNLPMIGDNLFINQTGSNSATHIGDGIYISCQPTGSSEEEIDITNTKTDSSSTVSVDIGNLFDNPTFKLVIKIIIGCMLFALIFVGLGLIFTKISGKQLPTLKNMTPTS